MSTRFRPRRVFSLGRMILFAAITAGACSAPPPGDDPSGGGDGKADATGITGEVPTTEVNLRVLDGYSSIFDQDEASCLTSVGNSPATVTGDVEESYDLLYIDNRSTLEHALGLNTSVGGSGMANAVSVNASAELNILNQYQSANSSAYVLLRAQASYRVLNQRQVELTPDALALYQNKDAQGFLLRCGDRYANGIKYGGRLFVLLRLDTDDARQTLMLKQSLKAGLQIPLGPTASAMEETTLTNTVTHTNVRLTSVAQSNGFLISGANLPAITVSSATTDAASLNAAMKSLFDQVSAIREQLGTSVRLDACADGGRAATGCPANTSYAANTSRYAQPIAVVTGDYTRAVNAPVVSGFYLNRAMSAVAKPVVDFAAQMAKIQRGMQSAYADELAPFLSASDAQKIAYNLAAPATPVRSWQELVGVAQKWAREFQPDGDAISIVNAGLQGCLAGASGGDFSGCDPEGATASMTTLQQYLNEGRILPLAYQASAGTTTWSYAASSCSQLTDAAGAPLRLPNRTEIDRLATVVAQGLPSGWNRTVWFDNSCEGGAYNGESASASCGTGCGFLGLGCDYHGVVCVPSTGPQATAPDLSQGQTY